MTTTAQINGGIETTAQTVSVTAAPGSAGTVFAYTAETSAVTIVNTSIAQDSDVAYSVNGGTWNKLGPNEGARLEINLVSDKLYLRRIGANNGTVECSMEGEPTLNVGAKRVPISESSVAINPLNFTRARKALANVKMGIGNMRLALVGDSTVAGRGAVTADSYAGARPYTQAEQLAKYLTNVGIRANCNSFFGNGVFGSTSAIYNAYDTRVSWTGFNTSGSYTMAGQMLESNGAASFLFQPAAGVNLTDYEFYYLDNGAGISIDVGGAGTVTVPTTPTSAIRKTTFTAAASNGAFRAQWVSGNARIGGVICTNSALPEVTVVSMGAAGWGMNTTPGWASTSTRASLSLFAPDLTIIRLGYNDWVGSFNVNTFITNLNNFVTTAQATGDVILEISPYAGLTGTATMATMNSLREAARSVAAARGCGFNDHTQRWADAATMRDLGYFNPDEVHIYRTGLSDLATSTFNALMEI